MHSKISGVSDQIAADDFEGLKKAREWISSINWPAPKLPPTTAFQIVEPIYSAGQPVRDCRLRIILTEAVLPFLLPTTSLLQQMRFSTSSAPISDSHGTCTSSSQESSTEVDLSNSRRRTELDWS